jgi:molybdopterin/thiamine biosynthesis adenylyltransferase
MAKFNIKQVVIVGAGGTGGFLIGPLVRYLGSKGYAGTVLIADGDKYDDGNLDRQNFVAKYVGTNKADYQGAAAKAACPVMEDKVFTHPHFLSESDFKSLVKEGTVVINCTDNMAARKFAEDRVLALKNAAHICCGNERTHGQVQVSLRLNGEQLTPSIYDRFPEFNSSSDDRTAMSCEDMAKLESGGQIITANMMAASIALNYFVQLSQLGTVTSGIVSYNVLMNDFLKEGQLALEDSLVTA